MVDRAVPCSMLLGGEAALYSAARGAADPPELIRSSALQEARLPYNL